MRETFRCARCGEVHTLTFSLILNPLSEWQWWALCPKTYQPVLMKIVSHNETEVE